MEEQDPQDNAVLSDDMAAPKVEQQEVSVKSVYEGLVTIAATHGKLFGTNGKRADMMKFDLTAHAVFAGNAFIVSHGTLKMPVLETAAVKVDMTGLPWLTEEEKQIDPNKLFAEHYRSRPNGSEKFMSSNFKAKDIDEMTDDEIAQGMPRGEARVRLEAWILCAALDGTLEAFVRRQPNWEDGNWWWSRNDAAQVDTQLVIKTDWWLKSRESKWRLEKEVDGSASIILADGTGIPMPRGLDDLTLRAIEMLPQLFMLSKSLAQEAFKLEMRAKCYDLDPTITSINRAISYIETGRTFD